MTGTISCPACGSANRFGNAYCGTCGGSLRASTVPPAPCWNCRTPNPPGLIYCGACGQPLAGPGAARQPYPTDARPSGRKPITVALAIVVMVLVGVASGFVILTLLDRPAGGIAGGDPLPSSIPIVGTLPPEETLAPTPRPRQTPRPTPTLGAPRQFVCNESSSITGPAGTDWDLVRVDFRTARDYDRVIYQLEQTGFDSDGIDPVAAVNPAIPGEGSFVGAPAGLTGDTRLNALLVNGVRDRVRLDGYQPRGMRIVESLSTTRYQSHVNYNQPSDDPYLADVGVLSTIDVIGDGCHALRVVGWDGDGDASASVYVDIQR